MNSNPLPPSNRVKSITAAPLTIAPVPKQGA